MLLSGISGITLDGAESTQIQTVLLILIQTDDVGLVPVQEQLGPYACLATTRDDMVGRRLPKDRDYRRPVA
jgi:hypothetical protein